MASKGKPGKKRGSSKVGIKGGLLGSTKGAVRRGSTGKKRMTEAQEFEIMKLVLDKFLWLGFVVMGWGMFQALQTGVIQDGIWFMLAGAVLLVLFMIVIVKEYEIIK